MPQTEKTTDFTRRDFMRTSTAAVTAALAMQAFPSGAYAQDKGTLKIGLIGCGGRGSGAAVNALTADENTELVAMGDMFAEALKKSHDDLMGAEVGERVRADDMKKFTGFDNYKGVIEASDVVILASPPHFRPQHLRAAIDAGKHVFCEKPVATDVPGVKKVLEACRIAKDKNLNVVSGLCYRYDAPKIEIVKRIHDGAIGDIVSLQCNYNTGPLRVVQRQAGWDDMQWQLRNWWYFHWLSGDFVVEQSIHSVDKMLWVMKDETPAKISAAGGRVQRVQPEYGNVYDHFNSTIEWKNGVKCFQSSRQWVNTDTDNSDFAFGTLGKANIHGHVISGNNEWAQKGKTKNMYDLEHEALFKAIRGTKGATTINNGDYMCTSTLIAIAIRMSAYTGKNIYWDKAAADADKVSQGACILTESAEDLTPPKYEFGPLAVAPVAVPGKTIFA